MKKLLILMLCGTIVGCVCNTGASFSPMPQNVNATGSCEVYEMPTINIFGTTINGNGKNN